LASGNSLGYPVGMDTLIACPICDSPRIAFHYEGRTTRDPADSGRWRIDECRDCHLGFLNPRPSWDDLQSYYSVNYGTYSSDGDIEEMVRLAKERGEFRFLPIPTGKRLL